MSESAPDPISFAQEQIWVAEQLAPGVSVYGVPVAIHLRGRLDTALAARCLTEIVRRHEILRSRVADADGRLSLVADPPAPVELPVLDLRGCPDDWRQVVDGAARRPFDLARESLFRAALIRLKEDACVLFLNMHHLVTDGWSLRLFWNEFEALYTAWHAGAEPALPELPLQYRDFAAEQLRTAAAGGYTGVLDAWAGTLAGAPTKLELPVDHDPAGIGDNAGAGLRVVVPDRLRADAYACAKRLGVNASAMLGAAWSALLSRWTRQDDLLIGTPLVGRTRPEYERLIGLFVNTMPLRVRPTPRTPFADLARDFQLAGLDALSLQDAPAAELVGLVRPEHVAHESPLFQTIYSYEELPQFGGALPECTVTDFHDLPNGGTDGCAINLVAMDVVGELILQFDYDARLFDPGTVEAIAGSYLALLGDAVARPGSAIGMLRTSGDTRLDRELAGRPAPRDSATTLHGLVEQRARQSPGAPAIEREDGVRVSFAQINDEANRLARHLKYRNVRTGDRVAIALPDRSAWPVAVLAVLKAGGAYVPLAPGAPGDRNAHLLTETAPRLVLTVTELAGGFGDGHQVLALDDPAVAASVAEQSGADLEDTGITGRHVAYVPFTSGSTGTPKGTLVTHANLVAFTRAAVDTFGLGPTDRWLQIAAMTFDVHVEEFFPTWLAGGCVVFFDGELAETLPDALLRLLDTRAVTICELPTAYWMELVFSIDPGTVRLPSSMRQLLVGGERIPLSVRRRWPTWGIPLTNVYGLTETSVTSTTYDSGPGGDRPALPVGQPMPHAAVYVLDGGLAPVGRGVPGEIFLGGPGISDGLLNRPGQTALRFVPDPFADEPGARMYRTGDHGRWNSSGDLEFLGRADRQLKVRGHRVELGEIESVLDSHPAVLRSAVASRPAGDDPADGLELHAFVVGPAVDEQEVAAYLRMRLPAHMVPAHISALDQLPLTPHGKVDVAALARLRAAEPVVACTELSELEAEVSRVYCAVLKVADIDPRTNIFALGFHSLAALRLMTRLKDAFATEIPLADFLTDSSVTNAARLIGRARTVSAGL